MRQHCPSCLVGPRARVWRRRLRPALGSVPGRGAAAARLLVPGKKDKSSETGIRLELVQRIRAELAAGTYLTAEKWGQALDQLGRSLQAS